MEEPTAKSIDERPPGKNDDKDHENPSKLDQENEEHEDDEEEEEEEDPVFSNHLDPATGEILMIYDLVWKECLESGVHDEYAGNNLTFKGSPRYHPPP